ncbi:hypothetical protein [Streptomyces albus]|uniref:ABC transporter permease n=1 Tax=Streptomyces albus TaxID=1888 RepID=A0A8H1LEL4_9ACTN|nr:hypothetical protein [Streptomyces albus]TGG83465.1 hypothetical protein D8771_15750 [Streptomyces albus]UVN56777.1 hypothetical protein NR995_21370 [Streptomyces albus]
MWARLRAAPGGTLAFGALVLVTAWLAAALPLAWDASSDAGLRAALERARPADRMLSATASAAPDTGGTGQLRTRVSPRTVERADTALRRAVRAPLRLADGEGAYGVHTATPAEAAGAGLPRPSPGLPPKATVTAQARLAESSRIVRGRLPRPKVTGPQGRQLLEAAVSTATARRMRLAPGDSFRLRGVPGAMTVRVTGVFTPRGSAGQTADSPFWHAEPTLLHPSLVTVPPTSPGGTKETYWHFTAVIHPEAASALLTLRDGAELYFHHPLDTSALAGRQAGAVRRQMAELSASGATARLRTAAGVGRLTFGTGLPETLAAYERESDAVQPLLLTAAVGLATTAGTVLLLSAAPAAERRRAELALLRVRGISLPGLAGRVLAETALVAVPAGAAGAAAALGASDGGRTSWALAAAGAVTVTAALALPLRAVVAHRRPVPPTARPDAPGRRSRRRTVAELTVCVLAAGAVAALRQGGAGDGDGAGAGAGAGAGGSGNGGGDLLPVLAPVLSALVAALLLMRCCPPLLRLLTRLAARRRGPVAFLGLARAARAPSAVPGPALWALLVAVTVASFGGMVLAGVADGRDAAALGAVGADARLATPGSADLPPGFARKAARAAGVEQVTAYRAHDGGDLAGVADAVTVALVDAPGYARLTRRNGQGTFPAAALAPGKDTTGPLPALMSPDLARKLGNGSRYTDLVLPGLQIPVRPALVRDATPAAQQGPFVVVSREAVARARPDTRGTALLAPNTLLANGHPDGTALRRLLAEAFPKADTTTLVTLRTTERARYADTALKSGAERLYRLAALSAAGYSALAVVLCLLHTAPERRALLTRLRTLGLTRRQGTGLLLLESLPLYALTAAAGAVTSLAAVPLLGPGIDLGALAGTPGTLPVRLTADTASLLLPPLALLVLASCGLLLQARLTGGTADLRTETQEL